jgi:group I intron endonuclease
MGYIYRITNRETRKVYIGKTKCDDPMTRWKGHITMFQKVKGGCPALRDAVKKYGLDAFMFEVLIICFDEDCDRWEKEYIAKYNCIVPNGYNILEGGQGGAGFRGKTHTAETVGKIVAATKERCKDPKYIERLRENGRKQMANIDRKEFGKKVTESEKYKKALEEGRVGGRGHKNGIVSMETKEKIRKGVKKYYETRQVNKCNIEKHREAMAKAKGRKVDQFDKQGNFIKTHISIAEAARDVNISHGAIQFVLYGKNKTAGGYVWKYHTEKDTNTYLEKDKVVENEIIY